MAIAETIRNSLEAAFAPAKVEVHDESEMHRGHAGAREGGESHFRVAVVSTSFEGLSRVERQRRAHAALRGAFEAGVHALSLTLLTPDEASRRM